MLKTPISLRDLQAPDNYHKIYENQLIQIQVNPKAPEYLVSNLMAATEYLLRYKIDFLLSQNSGTAAEVAGRLNTHANQVFFIGYGNGIEQLRNDKPEIISCMCREKLHTLLDTNPPPGIIIPPAVKKILPIIDELLPRVGKVVVTDDFEREVEHCLGAGTLFFDTQQLEFGQMNVQAESEINNHMNAYYERARIFKPREDIGETCMLRIKGSPISACTFFTHMNADGTKATEIGKLWAGAAGNGLSQYTLHHANNYLKKTGVAADKIFAITKERGAAKTFTDAGYTMESLRRLQSTDATICDYLKQYKLADDEDRNVHRLLQFPHKARS